MTINILLFLLGQWRRVVTGAIVAVLVATGSIFTRPPQYPATFDLIPKQARIDVHYNTPIRTPAIAQARAD